MDPFKGQGGIQMLLTAEQEAQSIVASAKSCKTLFICLLCKPRKIDFIKMVCPQSYTALSLCNSISFPMKRCEGLQLK